MQVTISPISSNQVQVNFGGLGVNEAVSQYGSYDNPSWLNTLAWAKISGKPSTFAPSAHGHAIADINTLQAALDAKAPQLYTYTKTEVDNGIAAAIANLISSAPGALNTLDELAAAMGDDPNFAATIVNSLAGKVSLAGSYANPPWITSIAASKITGLSFSQVINAIGNNVLQLPNAIKSDTYVQSGRDFTASPGAGFIFFDRANETSAFSWSSTNGVASLFAGGTYKTLVKFNEDGTTTFPNLGAGIAKLNASGDLSSASLGIADVTSLQAALDAKAPQADTYTKSQVDTSISAAIANLISSAPGALDTFDELAAALGDDPNFAATIVNSLAGKVSLAGSYADPTWVTSLSASKVSQSANFRFVTDTEKATWNGKQDALSGGSNNRLTKWTGSGSVGVTGIIDSSSSLYFPNNKGLYYRNTLDTADLTAVRWFSDNNLSFGESSINVVTYNGNFIGIGTSNLYGKISLGGETTLPNNISVNGITANGLGYNSLIKLDANNIVRIASNGNNTYIGNGLVVNNTTFAADEKVRFTGNALFDGGYTAFRTGATATNGARGVFIYPADHDVPSSMRAWGSSGGLSIEHWSTATGTCLSKIEVAANQLRFFAKVGSAASEAMRIVPTTLNVLVGTTVDVPSSIFTLSSTTKGFLPPRMTTAQFAAITSKAKGLEAFSNDDNGVMWFDGTRTIGFRYNGTKFQGYDGTTWIDLN